MALFLCRARSSLCLCYDIGPMSHPAIFKRTELMLGTKTLDALKPDAGDTWGEKKARINGTVAHTTAIFGFALAGLVLQDIEKKQK